MGFWLAVALFVVFQFLIFIPLALESYNFRMATNHAKWYGSEYGRALSRTWARGIAGCACVWPPSLALLARPPGTEDERPCAATDPSAICHPRSCRYADWFRTWPRITETAKELFIFHFSLPWAIIFLSPTSCTHYKVQCALTVVPTANPRHTCA